MPRPHAPPSPPRPQRPIKSQRPPSPPPAWQHPEHPAAPSLRIAIKALTKSARAADLSGDFHFALGLADALLRQGHAVRIDTMDHWPSPDGQTPADVDLALCGARFAPTPGVPLVIWLIYPERARPDLHAICANAAHVFMASRPALRRFRAAARLPRATLLHQAFDAARMFPPADPATARDGITFVASNHPAVRDRRLMVDLALTTDTPLRLFGRWWQGHPIHRHLVAEYIENRDLGVLYRGSDVVLCDHRPAMRRLGFASNRILDALACATPVICDQVTGLPRDMRPFIHRVATAEEFRRALAEIRTEDADRRAERLAFARSMAATHSFDARAAQMLPVLMQAAGRG